MAPRDGWRGHGVVWAARRSAARQAARSTGPTAGGGRASTRRPSLRQADDGRMPQRQHVMDTWLELAPPVEAARLEETTGPGISLIDQAIDLAEIGPGGAELDVGEHQADLGLAGIALILLQHALAEHDLDALRQDAGQGVVRWAAWIGSAVVDGRDVGRPELNRFREADVLGHRPIDELFIADPVGIEQTRDSGRGGHGIRHAAGGKDLLACPSQVGGDDGAG